jgi:membrane-bound metal-dependent hydrolase YbcI (DUF457 family)
MRTYTHGIIGYLLYLKGTAEQQTLAVLGAMLPDLFLAIGFIFHFSGDSPAAKFLHDIFHHSFLHRATEMMHSFVFILPFLLISWIFYKRYLPFFVGMLSHAIVDLLTHQRWAYNHFIPIPLEPIMGVVSYTSLWFTVVEHLVVLGFLAWFLRKRYLNKSSKS